MGTKLSKQNWYDVEVPSYLRAHGRRELITVSTLPLQEILDEEFQDLDLQACVADARSTGKLPPSYEDHPVVKEAPPNVPVVPLAVYVDGVNFGRTDSALGFWVYSLLGGIHHCAAVLRKSEMCRCGCRKWCSLYPIFAWLRWCLECLAGGVWPSCRHDGTAFGESDKQRAGKAGQELGWRGALLLLKADWAEVAATLGFMNWKSSDFPCNFCTCTLRTMFEIAGLSPVSFPHRLLDWDDYEGACAGCEIVRDFTADEIAILLGTLVYDKRKTAAGACGRALPADCLGLEKNDRLEPSRELPDIGLLDSVRGGVRLTFWRRSRERGVKHRNPIFCKRIGVTPSRTIAIDWLHCLSLGVFQDFLAFLMFAVMHVDMLFCALANAEVRAIIACSRIQSELFEWYGAEARQHRQHNRVQHIEPKCFGTVSAPCFSFHGAETNGFLEFSVAFLQEHRNLSRHEEWSRCAMLLCDIKTCIYEHPVSFPPRTMQAISQGRIAECRLLIARAKSYCTSASAMSPCAGILCEVHGGRQLVYSTADTNEAQAPSAFAFGGKDLPETWLLGCPCPPPVPTGPSSWWGLPPPRCSRSTSAPSSWWGLPPPRALPGAPTAPAPTRLILLGYRHLEPLTFPPGGLPPSPSLRGHFPGLGPACPDP